MDSILQILQKVRSLPCVPCNIKLFFYTKIIGSIELNKVAICSAGYEKEVEQAKDFEYCKHCIVISEDQYNEIFKPLFEDISFLNKEIKSLQDKI